MTDDFKEYVVVHAQRVIPVGQYSVQDHVLLVHKDRPPHLAGRLNLVGGKMEPGETPVEAAVRELKEESGLDPCSVDYDGILECGRITYSGGVIHCVRVSVNYFQKLSPRPGETEKVEWFTFKEAFADLRLMPNLRLTVPMMHAGLTGWEISDVIESKPLVRHTVSVTLPGGENDVSNL